MHVGQRRAKPQSWRVPSLPWLLVKKALDREAWATSSGMQMLPLPKYVMWHWQVKLPAVLMQAALAAVQRREEPSMTHDDGMAALAWPRMHGEGAGACLSSRPGPAHTRPRPHCSWAPPSCIRHSPGAWMRAIAGALYACMDYFSSG